MTQLWRTFTIASGCKGIDDLPSLLIGKTELFDKTERYAVLMVLAETDPLPPTRSHFEAPSQLLNEIVPSQPPTDD